LRFCVKIFSRSALAGGPEKLFLPGPEPVPGIPVVVVVDDDDDDDNLPAFAKLKAQTYSGLRLDLCHLLVIRLVSNLGKCLKV